MRYAAMKYSNAPNRFTSLRHRCCWSHESAPGRSRTDNYQHYRFTGDKALFLRYHWPKLVTAHITIDLLFTLYRGK